MDEVPNLQEALITEEMCSEWYCYAKDKMNYDSHPLSFQQLDKAQKADKMIMKILKMEKTLYHLHSFHGGGGGK